MSGRHRRACPQCGGYDLIAVVTQMSGAFYYADARNGVTSVRTGDERRYSEPETTIVCEDCQWMGPQECLRWQPVE